MDKEHQEYGEGCMLEAVGTEIKVPMEETAVSGEVTGFWVGN